MAARADGKPEMMTTLHPAGKSGTRVNRPTYESFREAILRAVPRTERGVAFKELPALVREHLDGAARDRDVSCTWWTTTVKLDLEARGLIERVPGASPQRLRRVRS